MEGSLTETISSANTVLGNRRTLLLKQRKAVWLLVLLLSLTSLTLTNSFFSYGAESLHLTIKIPKPFGIVRLDNTTYTADENGITSLDLRPGNHMVQVPDGFYGSEAPGTRLTFKKWNDGILNNPRSIDLNGDMSLSAIYSREFFLKVESQYGNVTGQGWYEEGLNAEVAVTPLEITHGESRFVFVRWNGSVNSTEPRISVLMDTPKQVTALWQETKIATVPQPSLTSFLTPVIVIAITSVGAGLAYWKLGHRRSPAGKDTAHNASDMITAFVGSIVSRASSPFGRLGIIGSNLTRGLHAMSRSRPAHSIGKVFGQVSAKPRQELLLGLWALTLGSLIWFMLTSRTAYFVTGLIPILSISLAAIFHGLSNIRGRHRRK